MLYIILNSLGRGGAERSIIQLADELVRRRFSFKLVLLQDHQQEYSISAGLLDHVIRLKAPNYGVAALRLFRLLSKDNTPTLFSLMPQANLMSALVAKWRGIPLFTSERTSPALFYRTKARLYGALLPHLIAARAVFISHFAVDYGLPVNAIGRAVRRRASVLHNPIACPVAIDDALLARTGRLERLKKALRGRATDEGLRLNLLIAGRLVPGKGVLEFLRMHRDFLLGNPVHLSIVGIGPLRPAIETEVQEHGLSEAVTLCGYAEDIQSAYRNCDVALLVSQSEGFGRVGFEAYLAGCLVIGLDRNSFVSELILDAPAWKAVRDIAEIPAALHQFSETEISSDITDIKRLRQTLSIERHTDKFLKIISDYTCGLEKQ